MSAEKDAFARFLKHFPQGHRPLQRGGRGRGHVHHPLGARWRIKKRVPHGEITVAVLEKGDFFGEMALLERIPRTAGAEMLEDGDLIVIGSDVFGDMVKNNPEIAVRMLRKYSLRLRETTKQIEELAAKAEGAGGCLPAATMEKPSRGPGQAGGPGAGRGPRLLHLEGERQRLPGVQVRLAHRPLRLGRRAWRRRWT